MVDCPVAYSRQTEFRHKLKPCLHSGEEISLRGLHGKVLEAAITGAAMKKPAAHTLDAAHPSHAARDMNEIGG